MTVEEFNRLNRRMHKAVQPHIDALAEIYEVAFARAAGKTAAEFRSQVVVTAAFVPPPVDAVTSKLTEDEQRAAADERDAAARTLAAILATMGLAAIGAAFLDALAARGASNFAQELSRVVSNAVEKGIANDWSAANVADEILLQLHNVGRSMAEMLAQTEMTTLVNERSLAAATETFQGSPKPVYKVWETMKDPRVRPAHSATQGQRKPISQPFDVGGHLMMYPGDPSAPLNLVCRCRCYMSYSQSLVASSATSTVSGTNQEVSMTTYTFPQDFQSGTSGVTITITGNSTIEDGVAEEPMADGGKWKALLAVEGQPTEDGRMLAEGSLTWRDLPLSLMAMDTTGPGGHEGAKVAGRIDAIWRDGSEIWGEGVFNADEFGQRIESLVANQSLRGNSIDPAPLAIEVWNRETMEPIDSDAVFDAIMAGTPLLTVFTEAVILASTVCPTPAIGEATIMLASGMLRASFFTPFSHEETLTASAAGMAPLHPPLAWFENPRFTGPTPLTVTKEGRAMGHAALWNSCHIAEPSGPGVCVPPPRSGMNYEIFHHGVVETAEGVDVPCGQITMSTLHAGRDLNWKQTLEHYEHSGCAVADVVAGEDRFGIWVSGGLRPDLPAAKVRELKAGALSGDWRSVIGRGLEFLAALVVNIPGFPVPRPEARIVASAAGEEEVLALVAAGIVTEDDVEPMSRREYLRKIDAYVSEDGFKIYSAAQRKRMAGNGQALPDGSFPIADCADAENAIRSVGRASNPDQAKAHIRKRVKALGCSGDIFDNWK